MCTSTQVYLLAKPICFYFFFECRFYNPWPSTAYCLGHTQDNIQGFTSIILVYSDKRRCSKPFLKKFPYPLSWPFRCNHNYIYVLRRVDPLPVNSCSMRKTQGLPSRQFRSNII